MEHWLERDAPPMSLPAVRFRTRLVQEFKRNIIFFALNLRTLFRFWVLGQDTSASNASLDSGENEYLVGQRFLISDMHVENKKYVTFAQH